MTGEELKNRRKKLGLTQEEFAKELKLVRKRKTKIYD
jgi:transcriptional regulator with XRE-family HTH domain